MTARTRGRVMARIVVAISMLLVLAWRTAGWWGLDRWVLPALGTPWAPGLVFQGEGGVRQPGAQMPSEAWLLASIITAPAG